jgi:hypothetical protein
MNEGIIVVPVRPSAPTDAAALLVAHNARFDYQRICTG